MAVIGRMIRVILIGTHPSYFQFSDFDELQLWIIQ